VHNRFATAPKHLLEGLIVHQGGWHIKNPSHKKGSRSFLSGYGAGNEARTRDLNLGKVALYQLSYSRVALL
jgi:hypothetical protein